MRSSTASSVVCCESKALSLRICNFRDFRKASTKACFDESRDVRAREVINAVRGSGPRLLRAGRGPAPFTDLILNHNLDN